MDLVKKLAIGAATISLAAGTCITPAFAARVTVRDVYNSNVRARAVDNDNVYVNTMNMGTLVGALNVEVANSGVNRVSSGRHSDRTTLTTGSAVASGSTEVYVNEVMLTWN